MPKAKSTTAARITVRCAIYTRKSSEEGLEQAFNSLDAQREACEAYIRSQKHEGWTALPELYDDGGLSGATLERAALQRLLAEIEAGRIDAVVVYKVDRLTRSLGDFAKIVEVFDRRCVSFVSVTQAFNTTTSMGRLTLNMLLSFAQFEREVTGERIRDKIAASKKKGLWMGGLPPLGYDVCDKKLVVNEAEAETVRTIYRRYAALGSVRALKEELDRHGLVSKRRRDRHGRETGGRPLARGALYLLLQNRLYRGLIVHKGTSHKGEHPPIVDEDLWEVVQKTLSTNRTERATGAAAAEPSLLAGLVYDEVGQRMTPSHANKHGTRYRYYVSSDLIRGGWGTTRRGRRIPAGELETLLEGRLRQFLGSQSEVLGAIEAQMGDAHDFVDFTGRAAELAGRWPTLAPAQKRPLLRSLIQRIDLLPDRLEIRLLTGGLPAVLRGEVEAPDEGQVRDAPVLILAVPARLKRTGKETRLLIDGTGDGRRQPDHSLIRLLAQAQRYQAMVMRSDGKTMAELATAAGVGGSYFTRILRLSFLAPEVVQAILHNRHPLALTAKRLANERRLPIAWNEQRTLLNWAEVRSPVEARLSPVPT
ncbi:MAG: recombinase family protein [Rhodospirillales bacterium]|nr:recombinase family protein [Rhodospirillales bacterium]